MRWNATVFYRSKIGWVDVQHEFEELGELQEIVEKGPNWNTIEKIEISLNRKVMPDLTIEDAEKL